MRFPLDADVLHYVSDLADAAPPLDAKARQILHDTLGSERRRDTTPSADQNNQRTTSVKSIATNGHGADGNQEGTCPMPRRGAMWPTELSDDPAFVALSPLAQWLFKLLWLHPDLDAGGFLPLQVEVWAKAAFDLTPQDVEGMLDELIALSFVSVDDGTGELWVRPFILLDAVRRPNIFVAAMRAAQTRRSRTLRDEAWEVIDELYRENPLKPPGNDADDKARKTHTVQVQARTEAYELLRARIDRERLGNRSTTVRKPLSNHLGVGGFVGGEALPARANPSGPEPSPPPAAALCSGCGRYPPVRDGRCAACLGREIVNRNVSAAN